MESDATTSGREPSLGSTGAALEHHLSRFCDAAGATSARLVHLGVDDAWMGEASQGDREPEYDRVLVRLLVQSQEESLTVQHEQHGTMVERRRLADGSSIVLIAAYDRNSRTGTSRQSGYVRHEIRRKLRQLVRALEPS